MTLSARVGILGLGHLGQFFEGAPPASGPFALSPPHHSMGTQVKQAEIPLLLAIILYLQNWY